jgi:hypothetical protein
MEVTLRFTEEEEEAYMDALNGSKYRAILMDLYSMLRTHDKGWTNAEFDTDYVRDFLISKYAQYNISLD